MPKTFDAILMCGSCGRGTLHMFHERRPQPKAPGPTPAGAAYVDLIYVCDICETERVWGSEPKPPTCRQATAREAMEEHAIAVHGMRTAECPDCKGVGLDCSTCGDRGEVWIWDSLDPCGPGCLLLSDRGAA